MNHLQITIGAILFGTIAAHGIELNLTDAFTPPVELSREQNVVAFQKWEGKDDLSVEYSVKADCSGLSFHFRVKDDVFFQKSATGSDAWMGDCIQLAFAFGDRKEREIELCVYRSAEGKGAYRFYEPSRSSSWRTAQVETELFEGGMDYRIFLPWLSLYPFCPFEDSSFRGSFVVNDNDGKGRKSYLELTKGIGESKRADEYARFILPPEMKVGRTTRQKFLFFYPTALSAEPGKAFSVFIYSANMPESTLSLGDEVKTAPASAGTVKRTLFQFRPENLPAEQDMLQLKSSVSAELCDVKVIRLAALKERLAALKKFTAEVKRDLKQGKALRLATVLEVSFPTLEEYIAEGEVKRAGKNLDQLERIAAEVKAAAGVAGKAEYSALGHILAAAPAADPTASLSMKNGWFYLGERPYWLSGYNGFVRIQKDFRQLHEMGTTALGLDIHADSCIMPEEKDDRLPAVSGWIAGIERNRLFLLPQTPFHYLPQWLYRKYPEGKVNNTFWHFSPFHPAVKEVLSRFYRKSAEAFAPGAARIPFMNLTNEPFVFDFSDIGEYALKAYRNYLAGKYGSSEALNRLYGTRYGSFEEIPFPWTSMAEPDFSKVSHAAWFDYLTFRREAVSAFFRWMNAQWRKSSNIPPAHKLLGSSFSSKEFLGHNATRAAIDAEAITSDSSIAGFDLGIGFQTIGKEAVFASDSYLYDFRHHHFGIDLLRSFAKGKPLVNTENHLIPNRRPELSYPEGVIRMMLFSQVMHGLSGQLLWVYENILSNPDLADTALARPETLAGMAEATAEINFLMPLLARNVRPAKVALYYSWPSLVGKSSHFDAMQTIHHALLFRGIDIGFVSDRSLAAGKTGEVKVLILAEAERFDDAALVGLRKFLASGGTVVQFGENAIKDEYDRPRQDLPLIGNIVRINGGRLRDDLTGILQKNGVLPEWALRKTDGSEPVGVEWKVIPASADGRKYMVLVAVNWNRDAVTLKFPAPGTDLLTVQAISAEYVFPSGGTLVAAFSESSPRK